MAAALSEEKMPVNRPECGKPITLKSYNDANPLQGVITARLKGDDYLCNYRLLLRLAVTNELNSVLRFSQFTGAFYIHFRRH